VRITGVIRNTFQNVPWIEVTDFEPLAGQLDTAVLTHLYRGEKLMEQRLWQRAIAELSLAPGEGVPENATCAPRTRTSASACCAWARPRRRSATWSRPSETGTKGPDPEIDSLLAIAARNRTRPSTAPSTPSGLKDSERPMWEAFDGDKSPRTTKLMR
jgi:hypothetical protein